jgi:uncharacterized protein
MKIGVVSDTHLSGKNMHLPSRLISGLKGVDMIIHAGDIVEPEVLEQLRSICPEIKAVAGNMDSEILKTTLPQKQIFKAGAFVIAVMHGWGPPAGLPELVLNELRSENPDVIVFGHSHAPYNKKVSGVLLFNPGSVGDTVYAEYNSFGILEIGKAIKARIVKI